MERMTKTVRKIFFVWEYEKEEQWLNDMSNKGWQLYKAKFGKFQFETGAPGEYTYRLELLDKGTNSKESTSYLDFLQETGIEMVGKCKNWIYLRCKTADGKFDFSNRTLYNLTHSLKIQELLNKVKNTLILLFALSFCVSLAMEQLEMTELMDFFKGFCTGICLAGSFFALAFIPFSQRINNRVKAAIKELYACE
jgi:hypothetical protein